LNFTAGVGRQVVIGPASAGGGLAYSPNGDIGVYYYGDHGLNLDDLAASITSLVTNLQGNVTARYVVISGAPSELQNIHKAIGATIGEEIVGGAYALFGGARDFMGIAVEAGFGVELNLGKYLDKVKKALPGPVRRLLGIAEAAG